MGLMMWEYYKTKKDNRSKVLADWLKNKQEEDRVNNLSETLTRKDITDIKSMLNACQTALVLCAIYLFIIIFQILAR